MIVIDAEDALLLKELAKKNGRTVKGQVKIMLKEVK